MRAAVKKVYNAGKVETEGGIVLRTFEDVNMCKSFNGLGELAKGAGFDPEELEEGQYIAFYNRARTAVALYGANNSITKRRAPKPFRNTEDAIAPIVESFLNDGEIDFDETVDRRIFGLLKKVKIKPQLVELRA